MSNAQQCQIPRHLGLILDGNRRWATSQGLPTLEGHRRGYENLKTIAQAAFDRGVEYVSAYVFSTENWNRTQEEVSYLMKLAMKIAVEDTKELIEKNIRIVVLGVEDKVQPKLLQAWRQVEEDSRHNTGGTLALCFNYGGMREIADAVKQVVAAKIAPEEITEELIANYVYHPEIPPIDFMIRTSGEHRISNFMLWRLAYAELHFVDCHWPAFSTTELDKALSEYASRCRRFGGN